MLSKLAAATFLQREEKKKRSRLDEDASVRRARKNSIKFHQASLSSPFHRFKSFNEAGSGGARAAHRRSVVRRRPVAGPTRLGVVDLRRGLSNTASDVTHSSSRIPTRRWFGSGTLKHTLKASLCCCCVETIAFPPQYCGGMRAFTPAHHNLLPSPANECIPPGLLPCRLSWDRDCLLADAV